MTTADQQLENWSGSHRYRATAVHHPASLDELRRLLAGARGTLQVIATRHTFSAMGDADELIALDRLPGADAIAIDPDAMTATVGPAVSYAQLARELHPRGLALANLASLPHISLAGAIATATHGSGNGLGNLATAVAQLQLVTPEGATLQIARGDPRLAGAAVHLGALGVVTAVTVDLVPAYALRQDVYEGLGWDALAAHLDEIMGAGRSVSVFHDFGSHPREVWVKSDPATPPPADLFGARPAREPRHPIPGGDPESCTPQLGVAGPWHERLPHFRPEFTPSAGREIQTEFFVARADAPAALAALRDELADVIRPLLQIAELRVIAPDELWLSPMHGRDTAGLHFTWRLEPEPVATACAAVQRTLDPFAPRPHWGKRFIGRAPLHEYPRAGDFRALRAELDPRGVLANDWLRAQGLAG